MDAYDPDAATVEGYMAARRPGAPTSTRRGTLMTHAESIELFTSWA